MKMVVLVWVKVIGFVGEGTMMTDQVIVICSHRFARAKASDVHAIPWDNIRILH